MAERIASQCICCGSTALARSPAILMPFVAHRVFGWTPVEITPEWGMRTLRAGMAYSICNSLQCQVCGVLFMDIRFSDAELSALYSGYRDEAYTALRDHYEPGYRLQNASMVDRPPDTQWVESFLKSRLPASPRVLDWGGDTGKHTPFRTAGGTIHVFDISARPLEDGVQRVDERDVADHPFDLFILSHVLEHVSAPGQVIEAIAKLMSPSAILYIETPHERLIADHPGSLDLAVAKKHWHEHINFFTPESMRTLLRSQGLKVIEECVRDLPSHANFTKVLSLACRLDDHHPVAGRPCPSAS